MHVLRSGYENIKRNWCLFTIAALLQYIYLMWRTEKELNLAKAFGINSCIADIFVLENGVSFLGIFSIPLILVLIYRCEKYSLNYNQAMRYKSHFEIWKIQTGRLVIYLLWFSVSLLLFAVLAGRLYHLPLINWSETNSRCNIETGNISQVSFAVVLLLSIFFMMLKFIILGLAVLLIKWLKLREIFGYIIAAVLAASEYIPENKLGFYSLFSMDYNKAVYIELLFMTLLVGISISGILYGAGILYAKRKEFINEESCH